MKQKIVIRVSMCCAKARTKAMEIAACEPGVMSIELQGDDKDQIVVTGEGIDSTCLTVSIRKKVGYTELVSVTPVTAKKEDEKTKEPKSDPVPQMIYQFGPPPIYWAEVHNGQPDPCTCTIM